MKINIGQKNKNIFFSDKKEQKLRKKNPMKVKEEKKVRNKFLSFDIALNKKKGDEERKLRLEEGSTSNTKNFAIDQMHFSV